MGILAKIEEMRLRRFFKKHEGKYVITGGEICSAEDFICEEQRAAEERVRNSPEYKVELFRAKYKYIELKNCPLCDNNVSLNIYADVYDGSTGFGGGYHIYAKIKCGKCSCCLDPIDLYTNIYDLKSEPDKLVSDYAEKWNTRYSDSSYEHRVPGGMLYKSYMRDIQFKEDKQNE